MMLWLPKNWHTECQVYVIGCRCGLGWWVQIDSPDQTAFNKWWKHRHWSGCAFFFTPFHSCLIWFAPLLSILAHFVEVLDVFDAQSISEEASVNVIVFATTICFSCIQKFILGTQVSLKKWVLKMQKLATPDLIYGNLAHILNILIN